MTFRSAIVLLALTAACGGKGAAAAGDSQPADGPSSRDPARAKADLLAAETSAYEQAKPVFDKYCSRCHAKGGENAKPEALEHFDMASYPFRGHHAVEIAAEVRKVLGIGGGKATMPFDDPGAVKGDELALIATWADAYDKAHEGGAHADRGHGGHHEH